MTQTCVWLAATLASAGLPPMLIMVAEVAPVSKLKVGGVCAATGPAPQAVIQARNTALDLVFMAGNLDRPGRKVPGKSQAFFRPAAAVTSFRSVPFFWTQHYDVPIAYTGHASKWETAELAGSPRDRDCLVAYRVKGRIRAMASIHRDRDSLLAEDALSRGDDAALEGDA